MTDLQCLDSAAAEDSTPAVWNPTQQLVCVPYPEPWESPSSWLTRLALSQYATVAEVLAYLGLTIEGDLDMGFIRCDLAKLAEVCGLAKEPFGFMRQMFGRLGQIDLQGERFLLHHDGFGRYRFCPGCLKAQRTNHFPVHWRFKSWRWCPQHSCLLRDRCPRCDALVILPGNMIRAGAWRMGVACLNRCFVCGKKLTSKPKATRFSGTRGYLMPWERTLLSNGRAVLAALMHNKVLVDNSADVLPLAALNELDRCGQLPHGRLRYENLDAKDISYRHPFSGELVRQSRVPREAPRKAWMGGLFDG